MLAAVHTLLALLFADCAAAARCTRTAEGGEYAKEREINRLSLSATFVPWR
jgi:hypothetical protein